MLSIGLPKILAASLLFAIQASSSLALAGDLTLFPPTEPLQNSRIKVAGACPPGDFTSLSGVCAALEHEAAPVPAGACPGAPAAITLRKDGDKIIWSLSPSLSKVSLNPIDDIRNLQVLLRYRF